MEALRRLRRNSSDTNVDRRLVTNVLLSFLATPREDAKRFEMLGILATILSWSDPEREKAGLQRAQSPVPRSSSSFWNRSSPGVSPSKSNADFEKTDETEVCLFSPLFFHSSENMIDSFRIVSIGLNSHFLGYGSNFFSQKPLLVVVLLLHARTALRQAAPHLAPTHNPFPHLQRPLP